MKRIPVDMSRVTLVATGAVTEKAEYGQLSDGSNARTGKQATNDRGVALWVIDALVDDDDDKGRTQLVGITVASPREPQVTKYHPVQLEGLVATIYRDRMTGQPRVSLTAEGIASAAVKAAS